MAMIPLHGKKRIEDQLQDPKDEPIIRRWAEEIAKRVPGSEQENAYNVAIATFYAITEDAKCTITTETPLASRPDDIGMDSLDMVKVIIGIEERIGLYDDLQILELPREKLSEKLRAITISDILAEVYEEVYKPKTS
ncbi:hypothetical protein KY335_05170 [Candidatus Woesearchaeota archaeon]|nr:hypothetical protein [Candidatus Woesearchaeota archaeon]MBW3014601.1 hypothetical protein [Candidatus Woesearchaeota archaeon]